MEDIRGCGVQQDSPIRHLTTLIMVSCLNCRSANHLHGIQQEDICISTVEACIIQAVTDVTGLSRPLVFRVVASVAYISTVRTLILCKAEINLTVFQSAASKNNFFSVSICFCEAGAY